MKTFVVLFAAVVAVYAQVLPVDEAPKPYAFKYIAEGEEGTSSHEETSDGSGVVRGSYSLTDVDGRNRVVEYVAGPEGYSASIRTNEPGTTNLNPADVVVESTAEHAAPAAQPAPEIRAAQPVVPRPAERAGAVRYVLVPVTDPRAREFTA